MMPGIRYTTCSQLLRKEVVILFCDKKSLQNEFSPFPRCFSVKSDREGAGIFLGGKKEGELDCEFLGVGA